MLSFEKFLLLCGKSPEIIQREKRRLFKSLRKIVLFKFIPEKKFEQARENELSLQKKLLKKQEAFAISSLKKLILLLMLDDVNVDADILENKLSPGKKYRVLFNKRIERCEEFLEFNRKDKELLEKTAIRYKKICELTISRKALDKLESGVKTTALVIGTGTAAFFTFKSLLGKVREKKREQK